MSQCQTSPDGDHLIQDGRCRYCATPMDDRTAQIEANRQAKVEARIEAERAAQAARAARRATRRK